MPDTKRPSGPGLPVHEKHDVVAEREQLDELAAQQPDDDATVQPDPTVQARHAEREAHTPAEKDRKRRR
jgi:hypothetical protein